MDTYYTKIFNLNNSFDFPLNLYNKLEIIEDFGFDRNKENYKDWTSKIMEVNTDDIVGTTHDGYKRLANWLVFFDSLKRTQTDSRIKYYSEYFTNNNLKENDYGYSLREYKGKYWIGQGNHRICIAKIIGLKTLTLPVEQKK